MTPVGKKAILCGSGELGKEVALELQRFGVEVIALDKYPNAPAMQVAHRSYVLSMLDRLLSLDTNIARKFIRSTSRYSCVLCSGNSLNALLYAVFIAYQKFVQNVFIFEIK